MDFDVQGSSAQWVQLRNSTQAPIHLVSVFGREAFVNLTTQNRPWNFPEGTGRVIIDTPAAIDTANMPELTRSADKILLPVLPSAIDIHACARCVQHLLLVAKVHRSEQRLGIIANRVRRHTLSSQTLLRFLDTLGIPIVATLRDSQNYARCAEQGVGLEELHPHQVGEDLEQWQPLLDWLDVPARLHRPSVTPRAQTSSALRL
jgi:chromosome partitioning protein